MPAVPSKLKQDIILEAVLEVRFITQTPAEVVFGEVYNSVFSKFSDAKSISLPILQIPKDIRDQDPNLTYQPHWMLSVGPHGIWVGPKIISFSVHRPYPGWTEWRGFILKILPETSSIVKLLGKIQHIGLRYVNFSENNLCEMTNLKIMMGETIFSCRPFTLQTTFEEDDIVKTLRVTNNATVQIQNSTPKTGSMVDVDIGTSIHSDDDFIKNQFRTILEKLHDAEKKLFFNEILCRDFIESLGPEYGGT